MSEERETGYSQSWKDRHKKRDNRIKRETTGDKLSINGISEENDLHRKGENQTTT